MEADVINRFRPLREFRTRIAGDSQKKLPPDADALHEAAKLWNDTTADILFRGIAEWDRDRDCPGVVIPTGYDELTYLLAWWCDQSAFSIDPTPLTDCLQFAEQAAAFGRVEDASNAQDAFDSFAKAASRVRLVLNRMTYAVSVGSGGEPPKPLKAIGRPAGTKGKRRRDIETALLDGEDSSDVAARLDETPNYVNKIRRQLEREGRLSYG